MHRDVARAEAVLYASFWINAERTGVVAFLTDYFDLAAPPRVATELTALLGGPRPPGAAVLFDAWRAQGLIRIVAPRVAAARFDPGENEAIALAQERGCCR